MSENGPEQEPPATVAPPAAHGEPPSAQKGSDPGGQGAKTSQTPERLHRRLWNWFFALNDADRLAAIVAIATVLNVAVAGWQGALIRKSTTQTNRQIRLTKDALRATRRQNRLSLESNQLAGDTAKRQLRAYATGISASLPTATQDGRIAVTIELLNRGQTPALGVAVLTGVPEEGAHEDGAAELPHRHWYFSTTATAFATSSG